MLFVFIYGGKKPFVFFAKLTRKDSNFYLSAKAIRDFSISFNHYGGVDGFKMRDEFGAMPRRNHHAAALAIAHLDALAHRQGGRTEPCAARAHKRDFTDIDAKVHKHGAAHAQFTPGGIDVVVGATQ